MGLRRRRRKPKTPRRHPASPAPAARQPPVLRPVLPSTCSPETEIRTLQKTTHLLLRKTPFSRLAGEICVQFTRCVDFSWQAQALLALQEAAEAFLVHLFEDAYLLSLQAGRVMLFPKDVQLDRRIRGIQEGLGWALATRRSLWLIPELLPVARTRSTEYKVLPGLALSKQSVRVAFVVSCFLEEDCMAFLRNRGNIWKNQHIPEILRIIFRWRDSKVDFTLQIIHVTDDLEDIRFSRLWAKRIFTDYFKSSCTI